MVVPPLLWYNARMQPEARTVKKIKEYLTSVGARATKIHGSDEGIQEVGIADLLVCYCGIFLAIEVKQPGARLRPAQRVYLHEIWTAGGVVAVVETVDQVRDLISKLEEWRMNEVVTRTCYDRGRFRSQFRLS